MGLGTVESGDASLSFSVCPHSAVARRVPPRARGALVCAEARGARGQTVGLGTLEVGDVVVGTVEVGDDALTSHASGSSTGSSGGACGKVRGRVWEEGPGRVGDSLSPLARAMCFRNQNRCCRTASRRCARRMFSST